MFKEKSGTYETSHGLEKGGKVEKEHHRPRGKNPPNKLKRRKNDTGTKKARSVERWERKKEEFTVYYQISSRKSLSKKSAAGIRRGNWADVGKNSSKVEILRR